MVYMLITSLGLISVSAESESAQIVFKDVTQDSATTLPGEAKLLVSLEGVRANVTIAQVQMAFE